MQKVNIKGVIKKMTIQKLLEEIEKLKKSKEMMDNKRLLLLDEIEIINFTTKDEEEIKEKTNKIFNLSMKIKESEDIRHQLQKVVDDFIEKNFEIHEIKIFLYKYYHEMTFEEVAEKVCYSVRQTNRIYKKIVNTEI